MDHANGLRAARKARGLTMQELSELSGVPLQSIATLETKGFGRAVDNITKLADALGTTIEKLVVIQPVQTKVHVRRRERRAVAQTGDTTNGGTAA